MKPVRPEAVLNTVPVVGFFPHVGQTVYRLELVQVPDRESVRLEASAFMVLADMAVNRRLRRVSNAPWEWPAGGRYREPLVHGRPPYVYPSARIALACNSQSIDGYLCNKRKELQVGNDLRSALVGLAGRLHGID
jgi:hypothetical protein